MTKENELVLTREECWSLVELLDMTSGGNASDIFGENYEAEDDFDVVEIACAKLFIFTRHESWVPKELVEYLEDAKL